jgi:hypothetical protein
MATPKYWAWLAHLLHNRGGLHNQTLNYASHLPIFGFFFFFVFWLEKGIIEILNKELLEIIFLIHNIDVTVLINL